MNIANEEPKYWIVAWSYRMAAAGCCLEVLRPLSYLTGAAPFNDKYNPHAEAVSVLLRVYDISGRIWHAVSPEHISIPAGAMSISPPPMFLHNHIHVKIRRSSQVDHRLRTGHR